jgi:hypothetical protein
LALLGQSSAPTTPPTQARSLNSRHIITDYTALVNLICNHRFFTAETAENAENLYSHKNAQKDFTAEDAENAEIFLDADYADFAGYAVFLDTVFGQ